MKFEDAYCTYENLPMPIYKATSIYIQKPFEFSKKYRNSFYCPECKKVQLLFVNADVPYFRAYPDAVHSEGCHLQQDETKVKGIIDLSKNVKKRTKIVREIDSTMRSLLPGDSIKHYEEQKYYEQNRNRIQSLKSTERTKSKRYPRKRIDLPLRDCDFGYCKHFYGYVKVTWQKDENSNNFNLILKDIETDELLCTIWITEKVCRYLPEDYKELSSNNCAIVFFANIEKPNKKSYHPSTPLIHSDYLNILRL